MFATQAAWLGALLLAGSVVVLADFRQAPADQVLLAWVTIAAAAESAVASVGGWILHSLLRGDMIGTGGNLERCGGHVANYCGIIN